jgi:hypothetical protein
MARTEGCVWGVGCVGVCGGIHGCVRVGLGWWGCEGNDKKNEETRQINNIHISTQDKQAPQA